MKQTAFYIGVDIADKSFAVTVIRRPDDIVVRLVDVPNTEDGCQQLLERLTGCQVLPDNSLVVMECTGVYSERLSHFLYACGFPVCVEPPHKVKQAFYDKGKTDPVDSRQIAEYGYRYADKLHGWQPQDPLLDQVQVLLTVRESLKKAQTASRNARKALLKKQQTPQDAVRVHEELTQYLHTQVKRTETDVKRLLQQNPGLYQATMRLTTAPGVGFLLAVNLAVMTQGFTHHLNAREISSFLGMCPWPYESGTSVKRPDRSDKQGSKRVRKLLYLAALSAREHDPTFRTYYLQKQAEGKPGKLIVNNIANKLLRVLCGMMRNETPYHVNYRSINFGIFEKRS
jgi:transposase